MPDLYTNLAGLLIVLVIACGALLLAGGLDLWLQWLARREAPRVERRGVRPARCVRPGCGNVKPVTRMVPHPRGGFACRPAECQAVAGTRRVLALHRGGDAA